MIPSTKETDGFFARHFDRRISGAVSVFLIRTPITPNQITVAVTLLGIWSGGWFAQKGPTPKIIGSLLFLLTSILDGCDGEVARAKGMTSRLGGWLDLLGDNVVHVAVFYGLGIGLALDDANPLYARLGLGAALGVGAAAALVAWQTYKKERGKEGQSLFTSVIREEEAEKASPFIQRLIGIADALARRDFIYAVVVLAWVQKLEWFLWVASVGTWLYVLTLVFLAIATHR